MTTVALKISDAINAELTATCDALGYNDGHKFHLDKNSIEVIKDLIRYLRRDDDTHSVRRFLGQSKVLQKDLIKIFVEHSDKTELWNVLLRLLINLTSPALMVYNEELPAEKITRSYYLQILSHLQEYKSAMANDSVWVIVHEKLKNILSIESSERGEENEMIIERILNLIRNVLRVPASDYERRTDNDTTVHDEVLFALHTSGISDLLVYIASTSKEQQYHMQILEIIAFMLQGQNPVGLAKAEMLRSETEKQVDEAKLLVMRQKEQAEKMAKMKKYAGSRHSRFGGTYVVQNMKAIGDNEMICHKPYQKIEDLDFSVTKQKTKRRKNKNGVMNLGEERVSALSVRLFLKEFCVEFLNGAYNSVMRYARSCINGSGGPGGVMADSSHYLWALRFFMNFNRHYKFRVKYVSETISTEVFYIVQRQVEHNYEMMNTDKKKVAFWSIRLHLAVNAYQELLITLIEMDKCSEEAVKRSSRVIMGNIFYIPEYRDTILYQLLNYNELTMSRDYLVDLVTTVHIFLKMLKNYCEKERHVVVRKIKRKKPKKKTKPSNSGSTAVAGPPPSLEDRWDEVGPDVSAVLQQNAIPEVMPFDATIATPVDEQKGDAMKRIQKLLRCKDYEQAIGLLRSARDVWPENDSFGKANMPVEEEFLVLREIFFADLGVSDELPTNFSQTQNNEGNEVEGLLNYDEEDEDEEEEEMEERRFEESSFNFMDFMQRFANMRIVSNLTILLKQFDKNSIELNHYVLKMFHRIATECKMPAMMYQASIFRVFQRVFRSDNPAHKDLAKFGRFIFSGFAEVALRNPKAYMELLFWKSTKQAVEMTDGYDTEHSTNKKASRSAWTDAEEDELRTLFMEHQTNKYSQDLIDYLQSHLINQDRTRRGIIKKLKEMYLIVNSKDVRNEVQKRLPKEWSAEEVAQLTELWEQVKDEDDPVGLIYDSLKIKRSKPKIKEKLLELNLAEDAKQLRKKRTKKSDGPKSSWETRSASEDESNPSDSDNDSRPGGSSSRKEKKKKTTSRKEKKKIKQPAMFYSDAQLSGLLKDVVGKDMQEALQWLKESFEEAIEDRDEENSEGLALVPLTVETSAALDSPSFQRLLRAMGIESPDLEEAYWRIPASMLSVTVKKRCNIIDMALRGEFVEEATPIDLDNCDTEPLQEQRQVLDSDDESDTTVEAAKKSAIQKKYQLIDTDSSDEEDNVTKEPEKAQEKKLPKQKKHRVLNRDSSDDEDNAAAEVEKPEDKNSPVQKKRRVFDSDEEDTSVPEAEKSEGTKSPTQSKRRVFDSDEEDSTVPEAEKAEERKSRIQNKRQVFDSDEEDASVPEPEAEKTEENITPEAEKSVENMPSTQKKRRVLDSDEEDNTILEAEKSIEKETPLQKKRRVIDSDEEDNVRPVPEKSMEKKSVRSLSDDEN